MGKLKCSNYGGEVKVSSKKAMSWFCATMLSVVVMIILMLCLILYNQQGSQPESQKTTRKLPPGISNALSFEIISIRKRNPHDPQFANVTVSVKITNTSGKHIKNAAVTCIMQDDTGKSVAIDKETVIFEVLGGLAPGRSIYNDFTLYTYPLNMSRAMCNTEYVLYY